MDTTHFVRYLLYAYSYIFFVFFIMIIALQSIYLLFGHRAKSIPFKYSLGVIMGHLPCNFLPTDPALP